MIDDKGAEKIKEHLLQQLEQQIENLPEEQQPQLEALKEQIENMSNEELEDFLKERTKEAKEAPCLFCQIISNQIKSYKIFEDENFLAILDIMPASRGHTIILPKQHIQFLTQLDDELTKQLSLIVKKIIPTIINITKAQGIDVFVAQAQGIDQKVPHLAINLIPRYENDNLSFEWPKKQAQEKELHDLHKKISFALSKIIEVEEEKEQKERKEEEENEAQKLMKHIKERIP